MPLQGKKLPEAATYGAIRVPDKAGQALCPFWLFSSLRSALVPLLIALFLAFLYLLELLLVNL
jgi:hypothetical protein